MNKFKVQLYKCSSLLLCLFILLGLVSIPAAAKETESKTVRVGWYEGTYNTTGQNGEKGGYSYEYQQTVADYTGWKYEYVTANWSELLKMLQDGEIDLMGGVSYTEERADTMLFSERPMGEEKYYLYANLAQADISLSDLTTLNGKRIGMLEKSFDLILMDIQMPNMNGYKATQAIRRLADKKKATIPIIAMTANAFEEDRKEALRRGMNGHIGKPINIDKVEELIFSILE